MRSINVINLIGFTHHRLHKWVTILIDYAILIKSSECLITLTHLLYRPHERVPLHLESLGILQEYLAIFLQTFLKFFHFFHLLPGAFSFGGVFHHIS
jgi:hypothetical protein